jgi:thiosulfate reductase cytochrome b subunit
LASQGRYYLYGIFTGAAEPFTPSDKERFNPLQLVTYFVVFLIGMPLLAFSGILMLLPESDTWAIASRQCLASVHYCLAIGYSLFFAVHLYLATTGETLGALIRRMFWPQPQH